jgi:hypothetical protein
MAANQTPLPFAPIDQAIADARKNLTIGGQRYGFSPAHNVLDAVEQDVNLLRAQPSALHTMENFDTLKRSIWDRVDQTGNRATENALKGVYDGIKQAIVQGHPLGKEYADLMEKYQYGLKELNDIKKSTGLLGNAGASSQVARMLRNYKIGNDRIFDQLSSVPSGKTLPYMLAGAALNPLFPGGLRGVAQLLGPLSGLIHPAGLPLGVANVVAASPRVMGTANYALGAAGRQAASTPARAITYGVERLGETPSAEAPVGNGRIADAIYAQESGSGQNARTSSAGARGGMQIMPETFAQWARPGERIDNPLDNVRVGRRIVDAYSKKYDGDPARVAVAYFSGPGNVAPPGHPTPWLRDAVDANGKSTSSYVQDVVRRVRGHAEGGRIERASGGRIGIDHGQRAEALIRAAENARKQESQSTKPLLNLPDETITQALSAANRSI